MTESEFDKLLKRGVITLVEEKPGGVRSAKTERGYTITLRPDLPGLPVKEKNDGMG